MTSSFSPETPTSPVAEGVAALVGRTPLIALRRAAPGLPAVLLKHEGCNPGGSIRDRTVQEILRSAAASGLLRRGDELVVSGATNSAVAATVLGQALGYRAVIFHHQQGPTRLLALLEQLGARLRIVPDDPLGEAATYARSRPGRIFIDPGRREALCDAVSHIGREIVEDLAGQPIGAFVTSFSTGATLRHVAAVLRQQSPSMRVAGVQLSTPLARSGYYHDVVHSVTMERRALGNSDAEHIAVSELEAWTARALLARAEGLLLGPKGAAAVLVALRLRHSLPEEATVVALSIDGGQNYQGAVPEEVQRAMPMLEEIRDPVAALQKLALEP
jgi:cysteine synthase